MLVYALDDEELALTLLKATVLECIPDATVECFSFYEDFLNKYRRKPCDICFLDINMPGVMGTDFAKELLEIKPKMNIIFVTGYSEFKGDAMDMFASGYVMKPISKKKLLDQLDHLRYPIYSSESVVAKTFGNFSFLVNDTPVHFSRNKSQELLAYLIFKRGSVVSRKEIASIVLESDEYSRNVQKIVTAIASGLEDDLNKVGLKNIVLKNANGLYVDTKKFSCDFYDFLNNIPSAKDQYIGEFMEQYSWGEVFKGYAEML